MDHVPKSLNGVPKNNIFKTPDVHYVPESAGMGVAFYNKMKSNGDAVAQIHSVTGKKDTYASLLQRSVRTAIKMRSLGVTSNDIVTICSVNHLNSCVPLLATLFLGAKTANLDPSLPVKDATFLMQQVKPKVLFADEESVTLVEAVLEQTKLNAKIVVFGKSAHYLEFSQFLLDSAQENSFKPATVNSKDTAAIYFSSGTTGLPKGICLSHRGVTESSDVFCNHLGLCMEIVLGYSSMYWVTSISLLTCAILNKKCRVICPSFDAKEIWDLIGKYRVTLILLAPIQAIHMAKAGRPATVDTSSLKQLLIIGGLVAKELLEQLREMLPYTSVFMAYGLTENTSVTCCFNLNATDDIRFMKEKWASCGKVVPGMSYKVVDPETEQTLGPYQKGEFCFKSNYQMNGYYNMDSSKAWDNEGYLKTGDVVYYDNDACIYVVDRVKDMLKYQMWHIPPTLLENVLLAHPAVQMAVVVGLPHPVDGDHPMGAVVIKDSYVGKITTEELQKFVDEQVGERQKLRGGVKIVDEIPCTPSGKFKRIFIRDLVLRGEL